ncbi:hypothetical protein [Microbacterium sp. PA5]|uniref:hypothetical protein n=1 Tax=Microbacterium sp. PA5 TaxID=3416654 RepID=UPI003CEC56FF
MHAKPGPRPEGPDDPDMLAGPGVTLNDIATSLSVLGDQLREIGAIAHRPVTKSEIERHYFADQRDIEDDLIESDLEHAQQQERVAKTLSALRTFRRSYYYWERVTVEHALAIGFTQRRTAQLLGVGLSTINRWAQNPVSNEDDD